MRVTPRPPHTPARAPSDAHAPTPCPRCRRRAVRGHVAHADVPAQAPARSRRAPRSGDDDRVGLRAFLTASNACTRTRTHPTLCSCAVRHRRRPRPLCRSAQVHPVRSTTQTLSLTSASRPAPYPRPLAFAGTASRRWAPHRMPSNPRPAHSPNPHLTTTPARAQTCNFDVLYAVRTRVLNHQFP